MANTPIVVRGPVTSLVEDAPCRLPFHPLRLALTGREQGPEMAGMLPLIGRAKVLSRLRGDVS